MPNTSDQYDFFVSYARKDNAQEWVTKFIEALLEEHSKFTGGKTLKPFFDKHVIHTGDDFQIYLAHGIAQSRLFLAFISPNYFASEWCRKEWRTWIDVEIAKHILSSGARPIYLVEIPGLSGAQRMDEHEISKEIIELCSIPEPHNYFIETTSPIIKQLRRRQLLSDFAVPFHDQGLNALRREDLRKVLLDLAKDLDERIIQVRSATESANTVPPYNKKFTGRLDELLALRERLKDDQAGVICGIHGLGGIGKTELAFTYAHAFADAYPGGRFLIPCDGKTSLKDAVLYLGEFPDFREQISDEERKLSENYFNAIKRCLSKRLNEKGHILLVLDNVTDTNIVGKQQTDEITSLGPKLHLLATTRNIPPAGGAWLTLGELPDEDAMALFEKHRPFDNEMERNAAKQIVKHLGGFALAVELLAAWLAVHDGSNYSQFLQGLEISDLDDIADDADVELRRHNHEKRLTAVLEPVLQSLKPIERKVLEYAAYLPPDNVALPWLKELVEKDFTEELKPTRLLADPWKEVWNRLIKLALFSRAEGETYKPRIVRVHRLMQKLIKVKLSIEQTENNNKIIEEFITARCKILEKTTNWQKARWELEPLDALAWLWDEEKHNRASWLLDSVGQCWLDLVVWNQCESAFRRALEIDKKSFRSDHPDVARDLNNLAQLLKDTNRLSEAEPLYRRALEINEKSFSSDHPKVAINLNNLAQLLKDTNRLSEAEPLYRRALEINEKSFGSDHPNVAIDLNNLALLLQATNRLSEAEPLHRRALEIDEQNFGSDHPYVAIDLNNLAMLFQTTNRLSEAEPLYRRALEIDEKSFGSDHPNVARELNNYAQLLKATNRLSEVEPLHRRALEIDEKSFGSDHPNVARDLNNLAQLLKATNRLSEAEPLIKRALEIFIKSLTINHPNTKTVLNNYKYLLEDLDLSDEQIKTKLNEIGKKYGVQF